MKGTVKIVTIGGGSSYTPELMEGFIKRYEELPIKEIWLVDIEDGKEKVEIVGALAQRMWDASPYDVKVYTTLDRREALKDADFVTTQFRVGLLDARIKDERIPSLYGMLGQETNGAGGMFKAFRTIPVIGQIIEDMRELCPDAWLINFTNPSGMQNENHYTTAHDLSLIMKYCMKNSTFRTLAGLKSCIIPATNKYEERIFKTTNDLLISDNRDVQSNYYYRYAIAGKTGYTTEAKNCLVSVANKDGFELICVVLGVGVIPNNLSGKFLDTKNLFEYGYNNYAIKKIRDKNAIATQITISNATKETQNLDLLLSDDITVLTSQNASESDFSPTITLKDNLLAPIAQGQVLGKITYTVDGVDYSSDLIAANNVELSSSYVFAIQIVLIVIILFLLYKLLFGGNNKTKNYKRKSFRLFK